MQVPYEIESWRGRWFYGLGAVYSRGYRRREDAQRAAEEEIAATGHTPVPAEAWDETQDPARAN